MERAYIDHKYYALDTGKGVVVLCPTGTNHIHVNLHMPSAYGDERKALEAAGLTWSPVTIRNVELSGSMHLYRQSDGTWSPVAPEGHIKSAYLYQHDHRDATEHRKRDAVRIVSDAVTAWVAANPGAMVEAERGRLSNAIRDKQEKVHEAREALDTLERELGALEAEEGALLVNLEGF